MTYQYTINTNLTITTNLVGVNENNTKTIIQQLFANIDNKLYIPLDNNWDNNIRKQIIPHFEKELKRILKLQKKIKNRNIGVDKAYQQIKAKDYTFGTIEITFSSKEKEVHQKLLEITSKTNWAGGGR